MPLPKYSGASAPNPASTDASEESPQLKLVPKRREIWAVGGGKGGIGKTLLTSNLGIYLSWMKKRVVVVDMDLGAANLHTALGVNAPAKSLSDLVYGNLTDVSELIAKTPIDRLSLISGAMDNVDIANMRHMHKVRLMRRFRDIDADIVLIDLGAGTTFNTLDFFLLADKKIAVVTPEPTAIENGYRFIKAAFYRMLRASTHSPHVRQLIETAMDHRNERGIKTPKDLLYEVRRLSPQEGEELHKSMSNFALSLIVNQVRVNGEKEIGENIQLVCERYFGIKVENAGFIPYDDSIWQCIRQRVPFLLKAPNSLAANHLELILRNLLEQKKTQP